jgi:integrase
MVEKGLSPASVHKIHALLSHSFNLATRFGYLENNPAELVKLPKIQREKQEVLSAEQISMLLQKASQLGPVSLLRWTLALRYGLRQGECLALKWSDFDLTKKTITVSKTVKHYSGKGFLITEPKSQNSIRTLPLDDETLNLVVRAKATSITNQLVFPDSNGTYTSAKADYISWRKLLKSCNLPELKLHAARHSAATSLLIAGVDIRTIQLILGHSTPAFTMATYLHPNQDQMLAAFEKVTQKLNK